MIIDVTQDRIQNIIFPTLSFNAIERIPSQLCLPQATDTTPEVILRSCEYTSSATLEKSSNNWNSLAGLLVVPGTNNIDNRTSVFSFEHKLIRVSPSFPDNDVALDVLNITSHSDFGMLWQEVRVWDRR